MYIKDKSSGELLKIFLEMLSKAGYEMAGALISLLDSALLRNDLPFIENVANELKAISDLPGHREHRLFWDILQAKLDHEKSVGGTLIEILNSVMEEK